LGLGLAGGGGGGGRRRRLLLERAAARRARAALRASAARRRPPTCRARSVQTRDTTAGSAVQHQPFGSPAPELAGRAGSSRRSLARGRSRGSEKHPSTPPAHRLGRGDPRECDRDWDCGRGLSPRPTAASERRPGRAGDHGREERRS
ncbi:unnamed protein product, partial [Prorocentrum cordatum]